MRENAVRAHWVIGLELTGPDEVPEISALTRPHQRGADRAFLPPSINSNGLTLESEPRGRT